MKLKFVWAKEKSFLYNLVLFIIVKDISHHRGKFKVGDIVRYNWKAKIQLGKRFLSDKDVYNKNLIITKVLYASQSNVNYKIVETGEDGGCAGFWLRKAYWWEN